MRRQLTFALLVAVVACSAPCARAATVLFDILLDGLQEVPPNASTGYGSGSLSLDDSTGDYALGGTFNALLGTTTGAQIQGPAGYGATGPLVKALTIDLGVHDGNFSGSGTFNMTQMADLTDEKYYVNIPSTLFTGGEIRGQIRLAAVPEPGTIVLLACGSLALAATAWRRR